MHIRVGDLLPGDIVASNGVWLVLSVKRNGRGKSSEISWLSPNERYFVPGWSEDDVLLRCVK